MISKLDNKRGFFLDFIDKSVFLIYPSGPITGKSVSKGFWFSFSLMRISADVFDEAVKFLVNSDSVLIELNHAGDAAFLIHFKLNFFSQLSIIPNPPPCVFINPFEMSQRP